MATLQQDRWVPTELPRFIRDGMVPRIILFPPGVIDKHDREPLQLSTLVSEALTAFLKEDAPPKPQRKRRAPRKEPVAIEESEVRP